MESYARQSDDETLLNFAKRIKGRAIRRCGQLLKEIEAPKFRGNQHTEVVEGAHLDQTRKQAATDDRLSEYQCKQALRVASIPEESFNEQIDSDTAPTLTELAAQGTKKKPVPLFDLEGIDPKDFQIATKVTHRCTLHVTVADPGELAAIVEAVEGLGHRVECPAFDEWSRLARRDSYLRMAHELMSGTPWGRCVALEKEIARFEALVWPRWREREAPPEPCSRLRSLLFRARRCGPLPATARQLRNIIAKKAKAL